MSSVLAELNLQGTGSCASFNFRRAARAVTRLYDQALESFGIRSTQFSILIGIAKTLMGRAEETEAHINEAFRLSPRHLVAPTGC